MKVKMVDVARALGVSKATVSLAVNGRPGVNEETRQRVLECIRQMEQKQGEKKPLEVPVPEFSEPLQKEETKIFPEAQQTESPAEPPKRMIKVVIVNHKKKVVCDPEMDLWSEVLAAFDTEVRRMGYIYGFSYLNESEEEKQAVIAECNEELVAGVILYGTELEKEDQKLLYKIQKPLVVYDCEIPGGQYSSVCVDNAEAVAMAVQYLESQGVKKIKYLGTGKEIYNFEKRREAFCDRMVQKGTYFTKSDVVKLGNTIPEVTENMQNWLNQNALPEGFVFENYQVSIGVLSALRKYGVRIPRDVQVVGIDEIPEYLFPEVSIAQIRIPHRERAVMAVDLLDKEIRHSWKGRIRMFAEPQMKEN